MRAGGAGGGDGTAWAGQGEGCGEVAGEMVDHAARHAGGEGGAEGGAGGSAQSGGTFAERFEPAAAGADADPAGGLCHEIARLPAGVGQCLACGQPGEAADPLCPRRLRRGAPGSRAHLTGDAAGQVDIDVGDGADAGPSVQQAAPDRLQPMSQRADNAHASDDDAAHADSRSCNHLVQKRQMLLWWRDGLMKRCCTFCSSALSAVPR